MTMGEDGHRALSAMRSGEWLRAQWIARVAFGLGIAPWQPMHGQRIRTALMQLERDGQVERRTGVRRRAGDVGGISIAFDLPVTEWRRIT